MPPVHIPSISHSPTHGPHPHQPPLTASPCISIRIHIFPNRITAIHICSHPRAPSIRMHPIHNPPFTPLPSCPTTHDLPSHVSFIGDPTIHILGTHIESFNAELEHPVAAATREPVGFADTAVIVCKVTVMHRMYTEIVL
ncbi:hypothetical protein C1H76_7529 [Elsinoe australis]|uniref:Uncharacterized protein n=1 Tax=Elsinoe australis TaxID=40998 RepID=A0A4U7AV07_9PEZI|nr:hypothetical protein C1H76_7529 [Elsinoe australis]